MSRGIITTHAEGTLQEPQYRSKARAKTSEVLEVVEDKAGGLLVIIRRQDRDDNNDEG